MNDHVDYNLLSIRPSGRRNVGRWGSPVSSWEPHVRMVGFPGWDDAHFINEAKGIELVSSKVWI